MKTIIKIEEAFMLALAVYLNTYLSYSPWLFWILFLAPDVGMVGYLINNKVGAFLYNMFHHKGAAIALYLLGSWLSSEPLAFTGLLLFGHSSFDRLVGYGLKYNESFHHTHLGWIGKMPNGKQ